MLSITATVPAAPLDDHDLLIRHDEQIQTLEKHAADTSGKLNWGIGLIITTLLAAVGGLLAQILKH